MPRVVRHRLRLRKPGAWNRGLFDRYSESTDQSCNLVELVGIANLEGPCKPNQALIIAHRGKIARNDRWHGLDQTGLHF